MVYETESERLQRVLSETQNADAANCGAVPLYHKITVPLYHCASGAGLLENVWRKKAEQLEEEQV